MTAYPRPDFQRPGLNWSLLDGSWDFIFDDTDIGLSQEWEHNGIPSKAGTIAKRQIKVPYAFQTSASGIGVHEAHEVLWYERLIEDIRTPAERAKGNKLLLRFNAVDYESTIWVDGQLVGTHSGGHVPFDVDVTDAFRGDGNDKASKRLTLRVADSPYDIAQPRGKQYWGPVPESIFYTPTSGIWLSVWLESVPRTRLGNSSYGTVLRGDDIDAGKLHAQVKVLDRLAGAKHHVEVEASLAGVPVSHSKQDLARERNTVNLDVDMHVPSPDALKAKGGSFSTDGAFRNGVALWAPEHPILYDLTLRLYDASGNVIDTVVATAGMRQIDWRRGDGTFRLNGKPIFQTLTLDQGYWPETGLTPPSQEALKVDIELQLKVGINGCRKHQKVEDPAFAYWADKLGFLVWGEIANAYEFSHEYIYRYNSEWVEAVKRDINHPSVIAWTPFNESWALESLSTNVEQRNHVRSVYYLTKALDPTRPINDNCGWQHVSTDLTTFHDYTDSPELAKTCSDLNAGILGSKAGHEMFLPPIYSGSTLLDPGSKPTPGAPVICSEFGGVNIVPAKGADSGERDWGYTTASDPEDFLGRLEKLVNAVVKGNHICGMVYTQT